jgi:hypothetical protein
MSDRIIRLSDTRADRLPQPDDGDLARAGLEKIVESVPIVGPVATLIFGQFFAPAFQRRRDDWFRELADDFDKQFPGGQFDWAAASQDEGFVSAVFSATQAAIRDSSEEKRRYLRNALLRVAAGKGPSPDQQATFFRIVEDLTASHVRLLDFFWRATQLLTEKVGRNTQPYGSFLRVLQEVDPDLARQTEFVEMMVRDLQGRGLIKTNTINTPYPQGSQATNIGIQFLTFLTKSSDED